MLKRAPNKFERASLKTFLEKRNTKTVILGEDGPSKICRAWNALQTILLLFPKKDREILLELYNKSPSNFKESVLAIYKENGLDTKTFKLVKVKEKDGFQWPSIF